jgi:predicted nucleic acid-binding protein
MAVPDIFVDTSALYALIDRNDAHHPAARAMVEKHVRNGRMLVTTDYIVTETINLANARGGTQVARRVLDLVEQSVALRIEWIGTERFAAAKAYFRKHDDHGYSFTDCTSFVTMRELRLASAFTTDRHFRAAGFQVPLLAE